MIVRRVGGAPKRKIADVRLSSIGVAGRMRELRSELVNELVASMEVQGLLQPIVIRPKGSTGYLLVAGRHRLAAAEQLKWEHIKATIVIGMDADAAQLVEIDENLVRGELSPAESAAHYAERKRLYLKLHPETGTGKAPGKAGGGKKSRTKNCKLQSFAEDTATKTGKHKATVSREVKRGTDIEDVASLAGTSLDSGVELDALAELPKAEQRKLAKAAKAGKKVSAKLHSKRLKRMAKVKELGAATRVASKALGAKLYNVIYADPPWRFESYSEDTGNDRIPGNHYPTQPTDEIAAIKVPAAKHCVLFLWATAAMLPDALTVMQAWGFTYKAHCIWNKDKKGIGYWFRGKHELLLVGVRGDIPAPAHGTQWPSVIDAPRGAHSVKPAVFRQIIVEMFPSLPRLEMFARTASAGWSVHGNEVPPMSEAAE
jgi:N6-adenosine-specific RNA methylase IME4